MGYYRRNGTKYNASKCVLDGHTFDSRKEAHRYSELKLLERAGKIKDLELQREFVLIPNQYITQERYGKNGKRLKDKEILLERKCCYVADFVYTDNRTGETVVEDTKGFKTADYILKRKMLLYFHGIHIVEV